MIAIQPGLSIRPVRQADHPAAARLISNLVTSAPFGQRMDTKCYEQQVSSSELPSVYPVRWQRHLQLGAWRAGELVGYIDLAAGHDSDSIELPDYQPLGLIRFLALPEREELINDVSHQFFERAHQFWQATGVGYVKAFHISTGYPHFQAGAGVLPGDWRDHVRVMTNAGFQFQRRYYCLHRTLATPLEESVPLADLSIAFRGSLADRTYDIYHRRTDRVGRARSRLVTPEASGELDPFVSLVHFEIAKPWRRQNIGRWLLRRVINDATLLKVSEMVTFVSHEYAAALNLLAELGFQELNYRGYTLDQTLSA